MIVIIDYGMGNLRSVQKGFAKVGWEAGIVSEPEALEAARGVVLPGVGAFADAMRNLRDMGMDLAIRRAIDAGKPFLGICLGQQLLFESSEEWGRSRGLGVFRGTNRRLPESVKVPHMGWNEVEIRRPSPIFAGIPDRTRFYFVHSYHVQPVDDEIILAETEYGVRFASVVGRGNVFGIQFHPEKSSGFGLQILRNFGKLVKDASISGD
ncbi:imidazole glycerol phosphate synthase subunit HisH [Desulforudis sp. 1088]|uniref:imidazole glycerol phosphate synthase subunit HisH n=1 Tax=unclassified Candidatus Desulforudis TaxID=2635950 RepID=UPI003BCB396B